jgi:polo-like kinase 4
MYEGTFICTLMANEPRADVEIRASSRSTTSAISGSTTAANRIRFSRKLRTMQIFSSAPRMSKKTMFCTARGVPVDAEDWTLLSNHEKECLAALLDFLRIVEALEGIPRGKPDITSAELPPKCLTASDATIPAPSAVASRHGGDTISPKASFPKSVAPTVSLPPTLPLPSSRSLQVTVSPRPRFPSALPRATSETFRKASSTAVSDAPPPRSSASPSAHCAPSAEPFHGLSRPRLQTRFMPGVGWCVRSGGTHYRIMFPDGVALEVDVDEEKIELVEHDGSVTRSGQPSRSLRPC